MHRARRLVVSVRTEPLAEPERGLWCPVCALPSAVRYRVALIVNGALQGLLRGTFCADCGWRDEEG
jgi:hypothetical protein